MFYLLTYLLKPSVLWRCWLGGRKGIRPVNTEWWGAGMVICLERSADLHMAQLMPLPLTVSCFSKIQIGFTFLVPAHLGSPGKRPFNGCVCYLLTQRRPDSQTHSQHCVCSCEWIIPLLAASMSIIRPGVHTITSAPRFNSAICSEMPVPPYTQTTRISRARVNLRHSRPICIASSRVGVNMIATDTHRRTRLPSCRP